ncbi:hypothetical protein D3C78_1645680 [compost metagenome]
MGIVKHQIFTLRHHNIMAAQQKAHLSGQKCSPIAAYLHVLKGKAMEWLIGIAVVYVLLQLFKPRWCDVCRARFKRTHYTWKIDGKKQHLCPACNSKMERRQSNKRFKDRFG